MKHSELTWKKYQLIWLDKDNGEIESKEYEFLNITEARKFAKRLFAESCINDLKRIQVRRIY